MSKKIGSIACDNGPEEFAVSTSAWGIEISHGKYGAIGSLSLGQAEAFAAMLQAGVRELREQARARRRDT